MSKRYPASQTFLLRLSPKLYAQVIHCARQERRSTNNWLQGVIIEAVDRAEQTKPSEKEGKEGPC